MFDRLRGSLIALRTLFAMLLGGARSFGDFRRYRKLRNM